METPPTNQILKIKCRHHPVENQRGHKNVISLTTHHKLFAFLSAVLECFGTFTTTKDMFVLRILFTQHRHKDECKQALGSGSNFSKLCVAVNVLTLECPMESK